MSCKCCTTRATQMNCKNSRCECQDGPQAQKSITLRMLECNPEYFRGSTGQNGQDGQDGKQGPQGTQGPQGPQGTQGPQGNTGLNGTGVTSVSALTPQDSKTPL